MKKQKIQLIILLIVLAAAIGIYFAVKAWNKKEEEKESADDSTYTALTLTDDEIKDITNITAANDAGGFKVSHDTKEDTWTFDDFPDEPVDTTQINTMTKDLSDLSSDNEITSVTDFAQYGLDDPAMEVTITFSDGTTHKLDVGDYNSQISEYYLRIDDSDTVYTISSTIYSDFNLTTSNLVASTSSSSSSTSEPTDSVSSGSATSTSSAS
ncbi:MAG: DUF4340 domain-containing protein [Bilifractor sp.]